MYQGTLLTQVLGKYHLRLSQETQFAVPMFYEVEQIFNLFFSLRGFQYTHFTFRYVFGNFVSTMSNIPYQSLWNLNPKTKFKLAYLMGPQGLEQTNCLARALILLNASPPTSTSPTNFSRWRENRHRLWYQAVFVVQRISSSASGVGMKNSGKRSFILTC